MRVPVADVLRMSETMSQREIAEQYGVSRQWIGLLLKRHGAYIPRRAAPPPLNPDPSEVHLFWSRVAFGDGCWEWTGNQANRYGKLRFRGSAGEVPAHRYSFMLHYGPIPPGMLVCHKCDNRLCVRPDHLYAGTQRDNAYDRARAS